MTQERIDVQVTDSVDAGVETKLRGIADSATKAGSAIDQLKSQLASVKLGPVQQLSVAAGSATSAITKEMNAVRLLRDYINSTTTSTARFNEQQRATGSTVRRTTSDIRAQITALEALRAAQAAANAAPPPGAGAGGGAGGPGGAPAAPIDTSATNSALAALAASAQRASDALDRIRPPAPAPTPSGGGGGGGGGGSSGYNGPRYGGAADLRATGQAAELASHQVSNLVFQLNDIVVSLASGQKPLTVFIQQGSQIGQVMQTSGMGVFGFIKALTQLAGLTKTVTAATEAATLARARQNAANIAGANATAAAAVRAAETNVAVATTQAAMATTATEAAAAQVRLAAAQQSLSVANAEAAITTQANATAQAELAAASKAAAAATRTSLTTIGVAALATSAVLAGLAIDFVRIKNETPDKEMKAYAESLGLTHKEMKKLKDQTVTYGDVASGLWKTLKDTFNFSSTLKKAGDDFKKWFEATNSNGLKSFANLYGGIVGSYRAAVKTWGMLPAALGDVAIRAANYVVQGIVKSINGGIDLINGFIESTGNLVPKINFKATATEIKNEFAGSAKNVGDTFSSEVSKATAEAEKGIKGFYKRWEMNSVASAKKRLADQAKAIIADRTPKADKKEADPKTQADYLNDENAKLDNQLARMKLLKDAREEQLQLDQIQEAFAKRRMPLDAQQLEGFRARIHAIQEYKYQQAEMDRIYEGATGPLRTYNAATAAALDLLNRGAITQQQYTEEMNRTTRAYKEATDPLLQLKEAMTTGERAALLYGDAVQQAAKYEEIRQAFMAKGVDITKNATAAQLAEVDALLKRNAALSQQQYVQGQVGGIVNPMLEDDKFKANKAAFYEEIDRMRQNDVLSEEQAARAKAQVNARYQQIQLNGASTFFDALSQLSQSKNSELAAIGKAAAVISATIKGYEAVQNTLATIPPPFNIPAAVAMAAVTGVQVANILSTPTNVGSFNNGTSFLVNGEHGIDQNTISMNVSHGERVSVETPGQQRANDARNQPGGDTNLKVVNVTDPRDVTDAMSTPDGEAVFMNYIRRNPKKVRGLLGV